MIFMEAKIKDLQLQNKDKMLSLGPFKMVKYYKLMTVGYINIKAKAMWDKNHSTILNIKNGESEKLITNTTNTISLTLLMAKFLMLKELTIQTIIRLLSTLSMVKRISSGQLSHVGQEKLSSQGKVGGDIYK